MHVSKMMQGRTHGGSTELETAAYFLKTPFMYISKEILERLLVVGLSTERSLLLTVPNLAC